MRPWLFAATLFVAASAPAATFLVPPDRQMIRESDAVVVGTVRETFAELMADGGVVTNIDLDVETILKGDDIDGVDLRVRQNGGVTPTRVLVVSAAASYWPGNRTLLFLKRMDDGGWRTYGMSLGKFDFVRDKSQRELVMRWGNEEHVKAWTPEGRPHIEKMRDARMFLDYIRGSVEEDARGARLVDSEEPRIVTGSAAYFVEEEVEVEPVTHPIVAHASAYPPSAYTQGPLRWTQFDRGETVTYRVNGAQPGLDSTGAAQRALAAWTNDPGSNIRIAYGGTTTAGFVNGDGVNAIVFNSPTGVPEGSIAYGQAGAAGAPHTYKGETFYPTSEGDVVVRNNLNISQAVLDEAVTHEIGHTLSFRHSEERTPASNDAVMHAVVTGQYGASLGSWDREAANTLYEETAVTPVPAAPANLVATATSTSSVQVTWSLSTGAVDYLLERSQNSSTWTQIATVVTNSYPDNAVTANTTYVYRVRARNVAGTSPYSNRDHATTIVFVDDPLVARGTVIKAVHLTQLRIAVNAMRVAAGLAPVTWTDPDPTGLRVRAVHITELRNALTAARTALGKTTTYTDPTLTSSVVVKAIHFQELRNYVK